MAHHTDEQAHGKKPSFGQSRSLTAAEEAIASWRHPPAFPVSARGEVLCAPSVRQPASWRPPE